MRAGRAGLGLVAAVLMALPATAQDATGTDIPAPDIPAIATPPILPNSTIASPGEAIDSAPILTLDQEVLYLTSVWGLRAQARLEAEGEEVAAENDRLTQLLSSEEARLTEQRSTLPAAEFRDLAENFDIRATRIRRERAQAVQALNAWAEADRAAFFRAARPMMGQLMQDRGAVAVLDGRTILVSLDAIDVTEQLVAVLNERIGDGEGVVPLPEPPPSNDAP
ncbi:OmpH family outer membrane protein [Paracoccus sp. Ld10]|uniref:OmpH family outer membrane protein n=1 Tax=Paracoccus sp. Ld10 TaxID=649158 RepID=UPI00386831FC